ncbi:MAG TPA: cytochrome c biogenesis CcdA family protein [Herpetosiphonaceae bacterium]
MYTSSEPTSRPGRAWWIMGVSCGVVLLLGLAIIGASGGQNSVAGLIIPAFLAGVLSFLSPCTLPVLPAYFAWTFGMSDKGAQQPNQGRIIMSSLAFFAGLATTMVGLSVLISSVSHLVARYLETVTVIGGAVIIVMGLLSMLGMGFAGPAIKRRQAATLGSAYLYGLTFALGWTACIGPILGAILTMLIASNASIAAGAALTFIYVLGLALPLLIVATFFNKLGQGSAGWRWLRGRAWELRLGGKTILLHSTNLLSGLLLILVGALLISGKLSTLNQYALPGGVSQWANDVQYGIKAFFTGQ